MRFVSLIVSLILMASLSSNAQIKFESGYFITSQGEKINCLIKDKDWSYNPTEFIYKLNDTSEIKTADISAIAEFGVGSILKYRRFTINIDRSSELLGYMTDYYEPNFNKEQLFLKVLIEGKATLYQYESASLTRFFFSNDSVTDPQQLVYKIYYTSSNTTGENNTYKQQLLNNLKGSEVSEKDIDHCHYKKADLLKIFNTYNGDDQQLNIVYVPKKIKRDIFDITLRAGLDFSFLNLKNQYLGEVGMGSQTNFRMGIEAEYILPFNKNKWSIIFEPTFNQYNKTLVSTYGTTSIAYQGIEFPIGIRYYLFLNDRSKFFINAALGYTVRFNSNTEILSDTLGNANSNFNLILGLGYKYNNRFAIEARYDGAEDLISRDNYWYSQSNTFSFIIGYTIFKKP
ncbi:MAG TPA: outer membrane beta-barrel protein [Ferruginibacter sp.]|nr:outer membrane beta-barrel protein [Ferruginibacter sp.]